MESESRRSTESRVASAGSVGPVVQCSTGSLAPFGGGRYFNAPAVLEGIRRLGWPSVELRLWLEWGSGALADVAARVIDLGVAVGTVHAPPDTEFLLSTPGNRSGARELISKCAAAADACGARAVVVHGWDARRPGFNQRVLVESLQGAAKRLKALGITLSVENIPGHKTLLPLLADACPDITFTADTQWTAFEDSWDLMFALADRMSDLHVQTFVDVGGGPDETERTGEISGGGGPGEAGQTCEAGDAPVAVRLGRTATGCDFDAAWAVSEFFSRGYRGPITLEPHGVPMADERAIRAALTLLQSWTEY